jgi:hypothetical protein
MAQGPIRMLVFLPEILNGGAIQVDHIVALMVMRHRSPKWRPEPLTVPNLMHLE